MTWCDPKVSRWPPLPLREQVVPRRTDESPTRTRGDDEDLDDPNAPRLGGRIRRVPIRRGPHQDDLGFRWYRHSCEIDVLRGASVMTSKGRIEPAGFLDKRRNELGT